MEPKKTIQAIAKQVSDRMAEQREGFIRNLIEKLGISLEAEIQARNGSPASVLEEVLMEQGYKIEMLFDPQTGMEHIQVWKLEEQLKLSYTINVESEYER